MSLCEIAIIFVINKIIKTKNKLLVECISKNLSNFFENCFKNKIEKSLNDSQQIPTQAIKVMINVIEFIRIEHIHKTRYLLFFTSKIRQDNIDINCSLNLILYTRLISYFIKLLS